MKNGDSSFFGLGIPAFHGAGSFTAEELKASALAIDLQHTRQDGLGMAQRQRIV